MKELHLQTEHEMHKKGDQSTKHEAVTITILITYPVGKLIVIKYSYNSQLRILECFQLSTEEGVH